MIPLVLVGPTKPWAHELPDVTLTGLVPDDDLAAKRRYFSRALRLAPRKYVTEYRDRWRIILPAFIGRFYEPFRVTVRPFVRGARAVSESLRASRA